MARATSHAIPGHSLRPARALRFNYGRHRHAALSVFFMQSPSLCPSSRTASRNSTGHAQGPPAAGTDDFLVWSSHVRWLGYGEGRLGWLSKFYKRQTS